MRIGPALELLACPVCGRGLGPEVRRVVCPSGHAFDFARSGYVNLTGGRTPRRVGDSAEMVRARARFLASGHLDPVADAVAEAARLAGAARGVVELGSGTGYYLDRAVQALGGDIGAVGVDLSKPALALAARSFPPYLFVAADMEERVPIRDYAADLVLSVFAPRPASELRRVTREGGSLVVAAASERHLAALRRRFDLLGVRGGKLPELEARLAPGFEPANADTVEYPIRLSPEQVADAVAMGPSARHGAAATGAGEGLEDRVSVLVARFRLHAPPR
jgi:23S rRNA (guanine745-N1)-methyltransferase